MIHGTDNGTVKSHCHRTSRSAQGLAGRQFNQPYHISALSVYILLFLLVLAEQFKPNTRPIQYGHMLENFTEHC
jgi:hypothetical protein